MNEHSQIAGSLARSAAIPQIDLKFEEIVPHGNLWLGVNCKTVRGLSKVKEKSIGRSSSNGDGKLIGKPSTCDLLSSYLIAIAFTVNRENLEALAEVFTRRSHHDGGFVNISRSAENNDALV